jgi:hypothetical protein
MNPVRLAFALARVPLTGPVQRVAYYPHLLSPCSDVTPAFQGHGGHALHLPFPLLPFPMVQAPMCGDE